MNTNILDMIIAILSLINLIVFFHFFLKRDSNYYTLYYRVRKLEQQISCMRSYIRINDRSFSQKIDELMDKFDKELKDEKEIMRKKWFR